MPSPSIGRGNRIASGSPVDGQPVDGRPAGVAEAEVAGDLVEGLAGGVVDGGAEHPVLAVALHEHDERVAARHQQHHERELEVGFVEERRVEVRLEVVDGDERHVPGQRERLGGGDAHEQRAHEARAVGGGDRVDLAALAVDRAVREPGLDERLRDDRAR